MNLTIVFQILTGRQRAQELRAAVALRALIFAIGFASLYAHSAPVTDLYDVVVRPADRSREAAFAEAMRQVAVRVSGSREAADRLASLNLNPARYVTKFSYQSDGGAAVGFDAAVFNRMLSDSGLPVWGSERPAVVVWLAVEDASGRRSWRSSIELSAERGAIERIARARGLPVTWPIVDAADIGAATAALSAPTYEGLMQLGARYRADAVLVGVIARDATVSWTFAFNDEVIERTTSLEDGVQMAADRCAQLLAVAPGALSIVPIQVVGIQDLNTYAQVLTYLDGLTVVANGGVIVDELRGDQLQLRLKVRGDAATLRRTLALGRRLAETSPGGDGLDGRLVFRLTQ